MYIKYAINVFLLNNILSSTMAFSHSHTFQHSQEHKMLAVPDRIFNSFLTGGLPARKPK